MYFQIPWFESHLPPFPPHPLSFLQVPCLKCFHAVCTKCRPSSYFFGDIFLFKLYLSSPFPLRPKLVGTLFHVHSEEHFLCLSLSVSFICFFLYHSAYNISCPSTVPLNGASFPLPITSCKVVLALFISLAAFLYEPQSSPSCKIYLFLLSSLTSQEMEMTGLAGSGRSSASASTEAKPQLYVKAAILS